MSLLYPNSIFNGVQPTESSAEKTTALNAMLDAVAAAGLFGWNEIASSVLTWAYFGGYWPILGVPTLVPGGTIALAQSATNYIYASLTATTTAGVINVNQTGFPAGTIPLYTVTCSATGPILADILDQRPWVLPVESPFCGYQSLSTTGGSTTLTQPEVAAKVINVTGALTSNATLVFPLVTGYWLINNNTTGSYTLSIQGASGAAAMITQGAGALIYCNGTGFYAIIGNSMGVGTVTAFTNLSDVPANYTGVAGQAVAVNGTAGGGGNGTGLRYVPVFMDTTGALWGELYKINAQTASYTLAASDGGKAVVITSATAVVLTLPQQSAVTLLAGFNARIIQGGAGAISFALQGSDTMAGGGLASLTTGGIGQAVDIMLQVAGAPNTWTGSPSYRAIVALSARNTYTKNQVITPALNSTASGTQTPDVSTTDTFEYVMTGNLTIGTPTDSTQSGSVPADGTNANFVFKQGGSGSYTLTLPSNFKPIGLLAPSMPTAVGARLLLSAKYFANDSVWMYSGGQF